jgi:hypothetical protein
MKTINWKASKTQGTILVSGCAPEIFGEYQSGKTKYKKRKGNFDFNLNELMHTKVCYKCFVTFCFVIHIKTWLFLYSKTKNNWRKIC